MSLTELKNAIESLERNYQIEIVDYLHKIKSVKLNENDNGIFVNLGVLDKTEIAEIWKKIDKFKKIESILDLGNNISSTHPFIET